MANKNRVGNSFMKFKQNEERFIERIDYREKRSTNAENVDPIYNNYKVEDDGSKVWSF